MAYPKKINPAEAVREIREAAERRLNRTVDLSRISGYKTLFMQCAVAVCPGFTVREEMKPAYNDIVHWAVMDYDGNLDPDKGLLIWGDIGTGKSTMLKIIREFCSLVRPLIDGNRYYFNPEGTVSRVEFLVMAMNAVGITDVPAVEKTDFADDADIPATMKGYVAAGRKLGLADGTRTEDALKYFPNEALTRAEAAVILEKLLEMKPATDTVLTFADTSEIPAWATEAVATLSSVGIITPTGGNISPLSAITRAQTAELLAAAIQYRK